MTREHVLLIMGALCVLVFYLLLKVSAIGEEEGDAEGSDLTAENARLKKVMLEEADFIHGAIRGKDRLRDTAVLEIEARLRTEAEK